MREDFSKFTKYMPPEFRTSKKKNIQKCIVTWIFFKEKKKKRKNLLLRSNVCRDKYMCLHFSIKSMLKANQGVKFTDTMYNNLTEMIQQFYIYKIIRTSCVVIKC